MSKRTGGGPPGLGRELALFYVFRLFATSYFWMPISVTFQMEARGLSFEQVMWLGALFAAVVVVVEIPTGALADRIGRRHSMMAGALAMVASCLCAYQAHTFAAFAVAEALAALSISLCSGADSAYLFDLLKRHGVAHDYPRREGIASAYHLAGHAVAFAIGGALGQYDLALPYLASAGAAMLTFLVAALLREESVRRPSSVATPPSALAPASAPTAMRSLGSELRSSLALMAKAIGDLRSNRRLLWIMGYSAVVFTLLKLMITLYQPYLDSRGFSLTARGLVFAGIHVLAAVVAARTARLRRSVGEEPLVWFVIGVLAVSFVLLYFAPGPWALVLLAVQAVASGLYAPLVKPMINREIDDSGRRATVLSIESIARRLTMGVVSPIAGRFSPAAAITACGALGLMGGVVLLFTRKRPEATASTGTKGTSPDGEAASGRGPEVGSEALSRID